MATGGQPDPRFEVGVAEPEKIIRCNWTVGTDITLDAATALLAEVANLTAASPAPMLVDLRGVTNLSREARALFVSDSGGATAVAVLTESAVSRMIANFFIGTSRTPYPVRTFTTERDAVEWCGRHV
jgi:hypothetical protein